MAKYLGRLPLQPRILMAELQLMVGEFGRSSGLASRWMISERIIRLTMVRFGYFHLSIAKPKILKHPLSFFGLSQPRPLADELNDVHKF